MSNLRAQPFGASPDLIEPQAAAGPLAPYWRIGPGTAIRRLTGPAFSLYALDPSRSQQPVHFRGRRS